MADQQYSFSTDSIPTQQEEPQGLQFSNDQGIISGNPNLKNLMKSPPPGQVELPEGPSGSQIGIPLVNALPGLGASAGVALAPEVAPLSGSLGASAGAAVANILRSYAPKYFSKDGQAPSMGDQLSNIGINAGLEGAGQVVAGAVPNLSSEGSKLVAQLPGIRRTVKASQQASKVEDLVNASKQETDEGKALKDVLSKGMKGGSFTNTDAIRKQLDEGDYHKVIADTLGGTKKVVDMINPETRINLKAILDQTDKMKDVKPEDAGNIYQKGGKYLLKVGTLGGLGSMVGVPHAYAAANVGLGALEFTSNQLSKIAQSPGLTKALIANMDSQTPPALAKLYQQGLMRGLRGESMFFQYPSGEREKVTISDQGVPQLPH